MKKSPRKTNKLRVVKGKADSAGLTKWLGAGEIPMAVIRSDYDMLAAGEVGIVKESVDTLAGYMGVTRKNMAEDILDLSVKTLERKGAREKLDKRTSSHVLEIARVIQHTFEVFEDEDRMRRWLNAVNNALNGKKPIELFDTLTGLNLVNDVLGRIEEGVYS